MISILVGGDICPMGSTGNALMGEAATDLLGDLLDDVRTADLSVANLECPLISAESPIDKAGGAILGGNPECARGLAAIGWRVLNIANNHSYDHGERGLAETMLAIRKAGMTSVGAGMNIADASAPYVAEIRGTRIVIYAMAEQEYSIASETTGGANPLDLVGFVNCVRQHKRDGVFLVLLHGGKEHYAYPTPEMVKRCRFMIDMGADAVLCCHAHCPLPWEIYAGRPIVYGMGNLLFEPLKQAYKGWHEGYLARLLISQTGVSLGIIPYHQSVNGPGANRMNGAARDGFFDETAKRGAVLKDTVLLEKRWRDMCKHERESYLTELFGYNRLMLKVGRFLLGRLHSRQDIMRALHLVQCETHREALISILKDERGIGA